MGFVLVNDGDFPFVTLKKFSHFVGHNSTTGTCTKDQKVFHIIKEWLRFCAYIDKDIYFYMVITKRFTDSVKIYIQTESKYC